MTVEVKCPRCEKSYRISDDKLGQSARCKNCGEQFALQSMAAGTRKSQYALGTGRGNEISARGQFPELLGRFQIRSKLGAGAFGAVYRAYDPLLDREVALKVPHPGALESEQDKARYMREPKAAAQLRHPNIVPVFDAGVDGEHFFIASAFIAGQTLQHATEQERPDFRNAATLVMKLAAALDYAHKQGIVHRDVKPANIMLDDKGEPMLMDFGLARIREAEDKLTHDGTVLGTPAYMSPEQARGQSDEVGPASDQYSLGVVLYELLCGERPFSGPPSLVISLVLNQEPPRPTSHNTRVPKDLETICLKAMTKEPAARYEDCQALADDLQRFRNGEPIRARRLGLAERLMKVCARNPVPATMTVAIALLLVIGTAVSSYFASRANMEAGKVSAQKERADLKEREAATSAKHADKKATEATLEKIRADVKAAEADRDRKQAIRRRYTADIKAVQKAWEEEQVSTVNELLDLYRPGSGNEEFRGFEWYYWDRLAHSEFLSLKGQHCVAFSPDGKRLATAWGEQSAKVWDATSGAELFTLTKVYERRNFRKQGESAIGPEVLILKGDPLSALGGEWLLNVGMDYVTDVAFSASGNRLATGSSNGTVSLWDATSGTEIRTLKANTYGVTSVNFSPDGKRLASAGSDQAKVWDAVSGIELITLKGHTGNISDVSFSPDGTRLASASYDKTVKLWDAANGLDLFTWNEYTNNIAFNPDGTRLASASHDGSVKIWDAASGAELLSLKHGGAGDVTFSPDGTRLASAGSDQLIKLWDAASGTELLMLKGHASTVDHVTFNPDGTRLASVSSDSEVKIWSTNSKQEMLSLTDPNDLNSTRFTSVSFNVDGTRLASASGQIKLWDTASGLETMTLNDRYEFFDVVLFQDGTRLVSTTRDQSAPKVKVWDVTNGQEIFTMLGHTGQINLISINGDGTRLASASSDGTVKVWDMKSGQEVLTLKPGHLFGSDRGPHGPPPPVQSVAFSSDGKRLASSSRSFLWDGGDEPPYHGDVIIVWDTTSGAKLLTIRCEQSGPVVFSPDDTQLASVNGDTVKVWDALSGAELLTLRGYNGPVTCLTFNPDGSRLAMASVDGTVKLWDTTNGQETLTLYGHTQEVKSLAFSSDGQRLASASFFDGIIKVWDARPWTADLRVDQEARCLLTRLMSKFRRENEPQTAVVQAIKSESGIPEPVRNRAMQWASSQRQVISQ